MERRPATRIVPLVTAVGLLLAGLLSCENTPTPTPRFSPLTGIFDVRRETPVVWAGSTPPLPELADNMPHPLPDGYLVTTNDSGEALLEAAVDGSMCRVYLFRDSKLLKRACPWSSYTGGNTSCLEEGSAVFKDCSKFLIMTPDSMAQVSGSWLWVIYMPIETTGLFVLLEGSATITPALTIDSRRLIGGAQPVRLTAGQFWYSAGTQWINPFTFVPPRSAVDLNKLPLVTGKLEIGPWLERARQRAREDGVFFPDFPATLTPTATAVSEEQ